jgi:phosphatidate phosphatase APP1
VELFLWLTIGRGYGNWTDQGWNLRFHGNVFKQPNITESKLDDLANFFLIGTSVQSLPPSQASQARNLTAEIYVLQQKNQNVTFNIKPAPTAGASGEQGGGGAVTPSGGGQRVKFPTSTTDEGDFDGFVQINNNGLQPGNTTSEIQRMNVYTEGDVNGNATAYLVPDTGLTIISDIDDILRITKIYEPKEGLLNSFARPFVPWMNMPDIYANWSRSIPNFHFHYLTTTPEQITRNYMDYIYKTYPGGSFDTRPLNFSDVSATLSIRKFLLDKIFQTYPHRKFILIADTSNSDVMRDYPQMVTDYPGQVQCIFLRNTTNTDPGDKFPYNTAGFKGVDSKLYMFFVVPVSRNSISDIHTDTDYPRMI